MSSPLDSYIGDSCGSFEFLPKESPLRRAVRAASQEETPPRDIKREIERRAAEIEEQREAEGGRKEQEEGTRLSNTSREGRRSSGSDRRSSGGQSGSEGRRRRRKVSSGEQELGSPREVQEEPRQVQSQVTRQEESCPPPCAQVLVEMARDIRPPPLEPQQLRSPRGQPLLSHSSPSCLIPVPPPTP